MSVNVFECLEAIFDLILLIFKGLNIFNLLTVYVNGILPVFPKQMIVSIVNSKEIMSSCLQQPKKLFAVTKVRTQWFSYKELSESLKLVIIVNSLASQRI